MHVFRLETIALFLYFGGYKNMCHVETYNNSVSIKKKEYQLENEKHKISLGQATT